MPSLLEQNPWLRNAETRKKSMRVAAASSSAVEGIHKPFATPKQPVMAPNRKNAKSAR